MADHQSADDVGIHEAEEQSARHMPFGHATAVLGVFQDAQISVEREVGAVVVDEARVADGGERERPKERSFVTPAQLPKDKSRHPLAKNALPHVFRRAMSPKQA
jgi:hypothetical protein